MRIKLNNPTNNRFYYISLNKDIFNNWILEKHFGGLNNNRQRKMQNVFNKYDDAFNFMNDIYKKKLKRGYCDVNNIMRHNIQTVNNDFLQKVS